MTDWFDRLTHTVQGASPPAPIAEFLGLQLTAVERGRATFILEVDRRFANPMGTLHGGILCDLADIAMGSSYASLLAEGESFTTLELKINFLRPVRSGVLRADGHVVRAGRTIGLVECDVSDEQDNLVARASCTCMTLRGASAEGR